MICCSMLVQLILLIGVLFLECHLSKIFISVSEGLEGVYNVLKNTDVVKQDYIVKPGKSFVNSRFKTNVAKIPNGLPSRALQGRHLLAPLAARWHQDLVHNMNHTIASDPVLQPLENLGLAVDNNLITTWRGRIRVLRLSTATIAVVWVLAVMAMAAVAMMLSIPVRVVVRVIGILVRVVVVRLTRNRSSGVTQSKQLAELEGFDQISQIQGLVVNKAAAVLPSRLSGLTLDMELEGG